MIIHNALKDALILRHLIIKNNKYMVQIHFNQFKNVKSPIAMKVFIKNYNIHNIFL